jgi:hypothetical protein
MLSQIPVQYLVRSSKNFLNIEKGGKEKAGKLYFRYFWDLKYEWVTAQKGPVISMTFTA